MVHAHPAACTLPWRMIRAHPAVRSSASTSSILQHIQEARSPYFPSSPKPTARVSRQTDSPRSSLAARTSAPGVTWTALQGKDLSVQEVPGSSHKRESAGAPVAPTNGQTAHHAKAHPNTSPHAPHHPVTDVSKSPQFASLWPAQQGWLSSSTTEQPSLQTSQVAHSPRATPRERRPSRQEAVDEARTNAEEQLARQASSRAREPWAGQIGTRPTAQLRGR